MCCLQVKGLHIFEGLAASGLRALRYGLEIPEAGRVVANDLDPQVNKQWTGAASQGASWRVQWGHCSDTAAPHGRGLTRALTALLSASCRESNITCFRPPPFVTQCLTSSIGATS